MRVYQINAYNRYVKQKDIAKMIGVHPSTISRELKKGRGKLTGNYFPNASDDRAKEMQKKKLSQANLKLTEETIKKKYKIDISYVTIYKFIHEEEHYIPI